MKNLELEQTILFPKECFIGFLGSASLLNNGTKDETNVVGVDHNNARIKKYTIIGLYEQVAYLKNYLSHLDRSMLCY